MELKPEIIILKAHNDEQIPYELLLLSDESKEAINKNLDRGELFLAKHKDKIIAAFILKITEKETIEIKNIAVSESKQNKGIGTILLEFIIADAKLRGFKNLTVGTCDLCEKEISFYKKSGFIISNIRKNFFIDNYKDPIFENGVQLRDMIMLSMELNSRRA
ncbi:MAG: GNAT family N-acetyltransferase [Bacteroidetes bacterium]|nr:GNAT family N-acetyltransferase [Bacteroidota bacterium]